MREKDDPTLEDYEAGNMTAEEKAEFDAANHDFAEAISTFRKREGMHLDAYIELIKILERATNNPKIKASFRISAMTSSLVEMLKNVGITKYHRLNCIFKPIIKEEKSKQTSAASKESHSGQDMLKQEVKKLFLDKSGQWNSIAEAVSEITPLILGIKNVKRPLVKTNAEISVRRWLSGLIATDANAREKLTESALARLKKPVCLFQIPSG